MPTQTPPHPQTRAPDRGGTPGLSLLTICLGFFVIQLDATIVNVALPSIGHSIGNSLSDLQWVVDSYTLSLAALMLTAGSAADRLGARRVFILGIITFAVGSAACAAAPDLTVLVGARVVQGIGAAALLPCSLALIVHAYPDHGPRARALGMWGAAGSIGMAAGPVLGGALITLVGWRAIFLVNVPVGIVEVWLLTHVVADSPRRRREPLDPMGVVLSTLALGLATTGFIESGPMGWASPLTVVLLAAGVSCGFGFFAVESRRRAPMMPPALFGSRPFASAVSIGFLFNLSLYGSLLCLSIFLQQTKGYSPLHTGLLLLPMTLSVAGGSVLSGRLTAHWGSRLPMVLGLLAAACGGGILATLGRHSPVAPFIVGTVALGLCSIAMPAMSSLAVGSAPPERAGLASGILNTFRQAGGALGVAVLGSLLASSASSAAGFSLAVPMIVAAALLVGAAALAIVGTTGRAPRPRAA
jgi:DHA2 family methylenomycin A resistance protein-like MFS transporter